MRIRILFAVLLWAWLLPGAGHGLGTQGEGPSGTRRVGELREDEKKEDREVSEPVPSPGPEDTAPLTPLEGSTPPPAGDLFAPSQQEEPPSKPRRKTLRQKGGVQWTVCCKNDQGPPRFLPQEECQGTKEATARILSDEDCEKICCHEPGHGPAYWTVTRSECREKGFEKPADKCELICCRLSDGVLARSRKGSCDDAGGTALDLKECESRAAARNPLSNKVICCFDRLHNSYKAKRADDCLYRGGVPVDPAKCGI